MAGTHSSSMRLGDDDPLDMTSGGETGTANPWFEFQDLDLTFVPDTKVKDIIGKGVVVRAR